MNIRFCTNGWERWTCEWPPFDILLRSFPYAASSYPKSKVSCGTSHLIILQQKEEFNTACSPPNSCAGLLSSKSYHQYFEELASGPANLMLVWSRKGTLLSGQVQYCSRFLRAGTIPEVPRWHQVAIDG